MSTFDLPIFPQDEENGEYLVFLPGVESTPASRVTFEVDHENDTLHIACFADEADPGDDPEQECGIAITSSNRAFVDEIQSLNVVHPEEISSEQLTDDRSLQQELDGLFDHIEEMESEVG